MVMRRAIIFCCQRVPTRALAEPRRMLLLHHRPRMATNLSLLGTREAAAAKGAGPCEISVTLLLAAALAAASGIDGERRAISRMQEQQQEVLEEGEGRGGVITVPLVPKNRKELEASGWERLDTRLLVAYPEFMASHLLHDTLNAQDVVEGYHIWRDPTHEPGAIIAAAKLGRKVRGHPNIVHGGATAALLDNSFGYAFFVAGLGNGFTANLSINYRKPLPCGTDVLLRVRVEKVEGRKVFMRGVVSDPVDGSVYAEATSLFIVSSKLQRQDVTLKPN